MVNKDIEGFTEKAKEVAKGLTAELKDITYRGGCAVPIVPEGCIITGTKRKGFWKKKLEITLECQCKKEIK